jgi:phage terminase large subunit
MAATRKRRAIIPYTPRPQFSEFHARSQRWACIVAHRRAGKTVACVNDLIRAALRCAAPEPRFAYLAPLFAQAKDVAWSCLKRYTAPVPGAVHTESELRADLPGGGRIRLYGADNPERLRGLYFDGVVLDEFGDMDPRAWSEVIRPALADRQGWAVFIGTPRGQNHFAQLWRTARQTTDWYALALRASETGLLGATELADARRAMTEEQYAQEFECSFEAALLGAYYAREMQAAAASRRIGPAPWEPQLPVTTAWDLGIGDSTAIWFAQAAGQEVRLIDYLENSGVGLDWYARELDRRAYVYAEHLLPHDAAVRELGTGRSRIETLAKLGLQSRVLAAARLEDGINASRLLLGRAWFDAEKCARGIAALENYRRDWDDKRKVFRDHPRHDWTSHAADAFRYLALGLPNSTSGWAAPIRYNPLGIV